LVQVSISIDLMIFKNGSVSLCVGIGRSLLADWYFNEHVTKDDAADFCPIP